MPADLFAVAGRLIFRGGRLTVSQLRFACQRTKPWWGRAQLVLSLNPTYLAGGTLTSMLNQALRDDDDTVALAAAFGVAMNGITVSFPRKGIHSTAAEILREFGVLTRRPAPACGIRESFQRMLGAVSAINWKAVFTSNYRDVEKHVVYTRALADTNASAWVNAMDVFNDWLLNALYGHDPALGIYTIGSIGSVMGSTRLKTKYSAVQALVESIHNKRLESSLSHAKTKKTGKPTNPIRWSYLKTGKALLRKAFTEIAATW